MKRCSMKLLCRAAPFALLAALSAPGLAAEPDEPLRAEVDAAMLRLADAGLLADAACQPRKIVQPPRMHHELGAVLDLAGADRHGAEVVAVTPDAAAARLGLRVGDRVRAINGTALAAGTDAATLRRALESAGGTLVLAIERDRKALELRGETESVALPGYELQVGSVGVESSTCGRINVFDAFPRGQDVYPVQVIAIDGRYPGSGPSFRVEPGEHVVTVAELIDSHEFAGAVDRRIRDRPGRDRYKDLTVDVRAGMTCRIAAQFKLADRRRIRENAYWEPIVWREVAEPCH